MADRTGVEVGARLAVRLAAFPWAVAAGLRSPELAAAVDSLIAAEEDEDGAGEVPRGLDAATWAVREAAVRERAHLARHVGTPAFQRAVAISQPDLVAPMRSYVRRFGTIDSSDPPSPPEVPRKARHLRLETTLVNLLLRGAGRPTPSGAWSGVFVVETDPSHDADSSHDSDSSHDTDLASDAMWLVGDDAGSERLHVQVDLALMTDAFRATAGVDLPVTHLDCWDWLSDAADRLDEPARARWTVASAELRRRCTSMGQRLEETSADEWVALHRDLATVIDSLRSHAGLAPVGARPTFRLDWRMPVVGRAPAQVRHAAAAAIDAWIRTQAAWGLGALWARATADALVGAAEADSDDTKGPTPAWSDDDLPTPGNLVARIGDRVHVAMAEARTRDIEQVIASAPGGWRAPSVSFGDVTSREAAADRMGPWGSALLTPEGPGFAVRSVRGEPAIFQARLAAILPEVVEDASSGISASALPCRTCGFTRYVNPGAALGASVAPALPAGPAVLRRLGPSHVGVVDPTTGQTVVPVRATAAMPEPGDPDEARLQRAASTWGWELVASGLPVLPGEIGHGGHLPASRSRDGVTVHPERWLLTATELMDCAAKSSMFERFVAWRRLVRRRSLPDVLLIRRAASPNAAHHVVLADSVLSVEALLRAAPTVAGVAVAMAGPTASSLVPGPGGNAHMAEVAVTFLDHDFALPV